MSYVEIRQSLPRLSKSERQALLSDLRILESLDTSDHRTAMTERIDRMEAGGGLDEAELKARLRSERGIEL